MKLTLLNFSTEILLQYDNLAKLPTVEALLLLESFEPRKVK